jgi:hypothetical protein
MVRLPPETIFGATALADQFRMRIEMERTGRRCAVVWRRPTRIGVEFR